MKPDGQIPARRTHTMNAFIAALLVCCGLTASAQPADTLHISRLEINRKKKEIFSGKDSALVLRIDTLIMKDRAQLIFVGKKDVKLDIGHARMAERAYIFGTDGRNNGTNFDIRVRFDELGALYVLAAGRDAANNGSKTYPNGNGGNVTLTYDPEGIVPQEDDKDQGQYIHLDTRAGGYRVNAQTDIANIYSQINRGVPGRPLSNLSQGMVYSGTPGKDGQGIIRSR